MILSFLDELGMSVAKIPHYVWRDRVFIIFLKNLHYYDDVINKFKDIYIYILITGPLV